LLSSSAVLKMWKRCIWRQQTNVLWLGFKSGLRFLYHIFWKVKRDHLGRASFTNQAFAGEKTVCWCAFCCVDLLIWWFDVLMCWWLCWCVDVLMCWWLCWCVDVFYVFLIVLVCWCVETLCWCVDDIVLMCRCVDVLMTLCGCVDDCVNLLMCPYVDVLIICCCVDAFMTVLIGSRWCVSSVFVEFILLTCRERTAWGIQRRKLV
jgi:hypothetical protein